MKIERSAKRSGRTLTVVLVSVLAAAAVVLVVFALRIERVPNAGDVPSQVVSPSQSPSSSDESTPSASPTSTSNATPVPTRADRFLSAANDLDAVRATRGACGGAPPQVETTSDGGVTWVPSILPAEDSVSEIMAVSMVSPDQIDLVVQVGPTCEPSVLTSYTGGEFWQLYPQRLAEQTYVNPSSSDSLTSGDEPTQAPCQPVLEVSQSGSRTAVRCAESVFARSSPDAAWESVYQLASEAIAWDPAVLSDVMAAVRGERGCSGTMVKSLTAVSGSAGGVDRGCAPLSDAPQSVALAAAPNSLWLWAGGQLAVSVDGGVSWRIK